MDPYASQQQGKLLIFTAPSGAGKTTIVRHLLSVMDNLAFSVSATTRQPRPNEQHGRDYYFIDADDFRQKISAGEFVEWEEVYSGKYYGTLYTELQRLWEQGKHVIFDIDVKGAINLKEQFGDKALTVFVRPPSVEVLLQRLKLRETESNEELRKRIEKAKYELTFNNKCDQILVNDVLGEALLEAEDLVRNFIKS